MSTTYTPYHAKLLEQAESAGCLAVRGSKMLGNEESDSLLELWTGRAAPYAVMKALVVLQNCLPEELLEDF
jgi:shikimate 5-dehydrogenase